ncbi:MAG: type II toxin-antitoxin system HigB family toxin [Gammaproteobacteria bacterium]|nr:type II toxin-antitoxin system HigB family toxin [Gammaproteobacteria bacterium]
MRVLGRDKISKFAARHSGTKRPLDAWLAEAQRADWKSPLDIRKRYGSVDFLPDNRAIFNIKGNHYRLVVRVRYRNGIVLVEWIGTHAEYDRQVF